MARIVTELFGKIKKRSKMLNAKAAKEKKT